MGDNWQIKVDLEIAPLREFKVSGPIHQPLDHWQDLVPFPSRDGFFYAVDSKTDEVRWKRKIGRYGDRTSDPLYIHGDVVLGTVRGEVVRFSKENGKSRWRQFLKTTVLASPAVSPDGRWVAVGDLNGQVALLAGTDGSVRQSFKTENEILIAPAFWNSNLVVTSEDNHLYLLSVPDLRLLHAESIPYDVGLELVVHGDTVYFATRDGSLHAFDLASRTPTWTRHMKSRVSNQPIVYQKTLLLGTSNGKLVRVGLHDGKVISEFEVSSTGVGDVLIRKHTAYFGTNRGNITAVDLRSQNRAWSYDSGLAVSERPLLLKRQLFVPSRGGNFRVMEVLE